MPDLSNLTVVDKLLLHGCKSLLKVHQSIGQLTNLSHLDLGECDHLKELTEPVGQLTKLGHLDLGGCVNLKRLPEAIIQSTSLDCLNLGNCCNLKRLPEQLGDMKSLKMLDASYTAIEQLPDSIAHLKKLVNLRLHNCKKLRKLPEQIGNIESLKWFDASYTAIEELPDSFSQLKELVDLKLFMCEKLRKLPEQIGNMESLKLFDASCSAIEHLPDTIAGLVNLDKLRLIGCSKLEQLPEQLGKMQCLKELYVSGTQIEELPDSIGLLSRLQVLDLEQCWKLRNPAELYHHEEDMDKINLPEMVKDMKLKDLDLTCNANLCLWLPVIQSLSSLERLSLTFRGKSFSPNEPYSLSKLHNLQDLELYDWTKSECSFPELPLNLTALRIYDYATLEMLPDLSSLKQLKRLDIWRGISLQSLPPLPPHLEELDVDECTSLQDLPDMSVYKELRRLWLRKCSNLKSISLKQSLLQVGQHKLYSFTADIPNREVAEWFSYKSSGDTLSFTIPPNLGDDFFGVGIKVAPRRALKLTAVITNKTKDIHQSIFLPPDLVEGEVRSKVHFIWYERMKSRDRIKLSFQSVPGSGEVKVKMCGAHLIPKTPSFHLSF